MLKKMDTLVGDKCAVGGVVTMADIWIYFFMNFMRSGFFDGIPSDYLGAYPKIAAIVANVAAFPELKAYYTKMSADNEMYKCFL